MCEEQRAKIDPVHQLRASSFALRAENGNGMTVIIEANKVLTPFPFNIDGLAKVHQTGCTRSVHPGVGVAPGGFTSPGGGSRLWRDRQMAKWLEETFARLSTLTLKIRYDTKNG